VRIPRGVLEQAGFISQDAAVPYGQEVELEVGPDSIVIRLAPQSSEPRAGWAEQLRLMAERGDDALLDADSVPSSSAWDEQEWEW